MKRLFFLPALGFSLAAVAGLTMADPPPADPLMITPEAGPWVICVGAGYTGPEAPGLARQLATQLRTRDHLAAYIFDRGDEERRKDLEEHQRQEAALGGVHLPFRHPRYTENCAVLIGGFASMEAASAALPKIKKLDPPDLKLSTGAPAFDQEFTVTRDEDNKKDPEVKKVSVNPLTRSFVVPNPTVPLPKIDRTKAEPILKELNASESYSLLKNPKPYTLAVKEYLGACVIQPRTETTSFFDKLWQFGRKPGESINAAGFQAHQLAEFLRDKKIGLDAYVLHGRTSSLVTVGGFDGPDDPELQKVQRRLESLTFKVDPRSPNAAQAKGDPIGLMPHPVPFEIPHF